MDLLAAVALLAAVLMLALLAAVMACLFMSDVYKVLVLGHVISSQSASRNGTS